MAGPADWGAVAVEDDGPEKWGAQPAANDRVSDGFAALDDKPPDAFLDRIARGAVRMGDVFGYTFNLGKAAGHGAVDTTLAQLNSINERLNPFSEAARKGREHAGWTGPGTFIGTGGGLLDLATVPFAPIMGAATEFLAKPYSDISGMSIDEARSKVSTALMALGSRSTARFSRPAPGAEIPREIGTLPAEADFKIGADALGGEATEANLRRAWQEDGIHPAEAVHDAQNDAFARHQITAPTVAYHGSPHDFAAFNMEKIGTGEGAQAYGHGLYFAENPAVAKRYTTAGVRGDRPVEYEARTVLEDWHGDRQGAISELQKEIDTGNPYIGGTIPREAVIERLKSDEPLSSMLYQTRIHADKDAFLDLDKKLNEQTPEIQNAVKQAMGIDYYGKFDQAKSDRMWAEFESASGKAAVRQGFIAFDDADVAAKLRDAGVPGLKYLDEGSRKTGEGTHNFVVFSDKDVEITHKNGQPFYDEAFSAAQNQKFERIMAGQEEGEIPLRAVGAEVTGEPPIVPLAQQPAPRAGSLAASVKNAADTLLDMGRDAQMLVAPMARGTTDSMAIAKDFANAMRRNRWEWSRIDADIEKRFTPEQRTRMWNAADEESVARQLGEIIPPPPPGYTRFYRGEKQGGQAFNPNLAVDPGRWFSTDREMAARYGDLHYVDLSPKEMLGVIQDANHPTEPSFILDKALADRKKPFKQGGAAEHIGISTLTAEERAAVEDLQTRAQTAWLRAVDLGMVEGEGLPAYTPRMVMNATLANAGDSTVPLNGIGLNLRTKTPGMRQRQHMTVEETEAAAKAKYGNDAYVARDIRALPLATGQLEDAIAGRTLINNVKDYGKRTGAETVSEGAIPKDAEGKWFTLDHPAFRTWRPKFKEKEGGGVEVVKDAEGNTVFEQVPIYVHGDFEGPLKAVLTQRSGPLYGAMMSLKGKTMSLIMNSPMIHNAVEWGRALPAMPGKVATFKVYFEGNRVKNDPVQMREAIDAGLVPIGKRFFNQDVTSIMEAPDLAPGRSLTAKVLAAVPGLFDEGAGTAVKRSIDKAGDFWHNTLLWDRIADLQAGLYSNFRDNMLARGMDRQTASRVAAHWANRYAGALPQEAMSDNARKVANLLLFSRSFTLGNLGAMKDILTGLPKDVIAQIERDGQVRFSENTHVGYHGTHQVFERFSDKAMGSGVDAPYTAAKGHFFSTDPKTASGYAEGTDGAGNVRRAQLNFEKPKTVEFKQHKISDLAGQDEQIAKLIDQAHEAGHDGLVLKDIGGKEGQNLIVSFSQESIENLPFGSKVHIPAEQAAVQYAKTLARRKAMSIVALDIGLMYVGNSMLQSVINVVRTDRTADQEMKGYADRLAAAMEHTKEHPLALLQPFDFLERLSSTSENEPGKADRIRVGTSKDGTAIYMRNPAGKIGEEFVGYMNGPLDMMRRKLGTIARPGWQILANDKGFGRKVYDPNADTPAKYVANLGRIAGHIAASQVPEGQMNAAMDLVKGEGDKNVNAAQALGPIAGVTFSKGAPGGPAVGEMYKAREMHDFQVQQALPDIRKQIQRGDLAGAQARMEQLKIPPGLQKFYIRTSQFPETRLGGRTLKDFYQYATPEQIQRMERAREGR